MRISVLEILIGDLRVGHLFRYGDIIRFAVDEAYANDAQAPLLSLSMLAGDPAQQRAFFLDSLNPVLNSLGEGKLPAFFQNLLPEGVLRDHIVAERNCDPNDHFEILAACGGDLPGNVYALPARDGHLTAQLVTQNNESMEVSVVDDPLEDGVSISGMQPKIALLKKGGRFVVARNLDSGHVIGKLPTSQFDLLPQVEELSLRLATAAGVNACTATLQPLELIDANHWYDLGDADKFLAVERFDRDRPGRLHAEDFAQILSVDSARKYTGGTYADIASVMLAVDGLGMPAVRELLRRIAVSELVGNYDFHLKNIGVLHFPGRRIELSPAYDIVAYSVYMGGRGHALAFSVGMKKHQILDPASLRGFCDALGLSEPALRAIISDVCARVLEHWPEMIEASELRPEQKKRLVEFIKSRPVLQSFLRRRRTPHPWRDQAAPTNQPPEVDVP
jgi:serine/threonine-protein kinase HipA